MPNQVSRRLFEALRLQIRYDFTTHVANCTITLTGDTINAVARTSQGNDHRQARRTRHRTSSSRRRTRCPIPTPGMVCVAPPAGFEPALTAPEAADPISRIVQSTCLYSVAVVAQSQGHSVHSPDHDGSAAIPRIFRGACAVDRRVGRSSSSVSLKGSRIKRRRGVHVHQALSRCWLPCGHGHACGWRGGHVHSAGHSLTLASPRLWPLLGCVVVDQAVPVESEAGCRRWRRGVQATLAACRAGSGV